MNLLKWLFGKKKVYNRPPKEVMIPKSQNFIHIPNYQSDSKWFLENERKKREDENPRRDFYDNIATTLMFLTPSKNDNSSISSNYDSSGSDNSSSGFDGGFGGGGFSGGGSSGSWDSDSSSSSRFDSGSSSYDSGSSSYDSGSCQDSSSSSSSDW